MSCIMLKNLIAKAGVKAAMNPIADDMKRVDICRRTAGRKRW